MGHEEGRHDTDGASPAAGQGRACGVYPTAWCATKQAGRCNQACQMHRPLPDALVEHSQCHRATEHCIKCQIAHQPQPTNHHIV